jgi:hypothetical protein
MLISCEDAGSDVRQLRRYCCTLRLAQVAAVQVEADDEAGGIVADVVARRSPDPEVLDEVAADLWRDSRLRAMAPAEAATRWLEPVATPMPYEPKNGILACVPFDLLSQRSQTLPRPAKGQPAEQQVVG